MLFFQFHARLRLALRFSVHRDSVHLAFGEAASKNINGFITSLQDQHLCKSVDRTEATAAFDHTYEHVDLQTGRRSIRERRIAFTVCCTTATMLNGEERSMLHFELWHVSAHLWARGRESWKSYDKACASVGSYGPIKPIADG